MSEREGTWPAEGKAVAAEISERIRSILADAEAAADAIRHQAQQDAHARRRSAETESLRIIEEARREAERFLAERIHRVSELSDEILERGQSVVERLDAADQVRSELAGLVTSLGETAARLANEVRAMPGPKPPDIAPADAEAPPVAEPVAPEPAATEPVDAEPEALAEPELAPEPEAEVAPEPELEPEPEPIAEETAGEPVPEEAADEPVPEPTPLRPQPIEPNSIELAPAAEPEPAAEAEEPPPEPTPEEIELLEHVRAAERERTEGEDEPELADANGGVAAVADGNGPELVEVDAAAAEPDAEGVAEPSGEGAGAGPDQALGARLVALQMAVAGGNRGEVEAHLRRAFDLSEPGAILDDIFGSGTTAEKRVVWPEAG